MNPLLLTIAILAGADNATTALARSTGLREGNPLLPQNQIAAALVRDSVAAVEIYGLHKLASTHPKLAGAIAVVNISAGGVVVGWNLRAFADRSRP